MPSSEKTSTLRLNRWLGEDKPKRDDFNEDNRKLDEAWKSLEDGLKESLDGLQESLESRTGDLQASVEKDLGGLRTDLNTEAAARQKVEQGLSAHTGDGSLHVTAQEKATWHANTMATGAYTGAGEQERNVVLGYKPRFGYLFAVGKPTNYVDFPNSNNRIYAAYLHPNGCSAGATLTAGGFKVEHRSSADPNGNTPCFNETGVVYVYCVWE